MSRSHKILLLISLTFLGIVFRGLYWIIGHHGSIRISIFLFFEGAISGFGVGLGILLANRYNSWLRRKQKNSNFPYDKLVPYCCGGGAVFLYKTITTVFLSPELPKKLKD